MTTKNHESTMNEIFIFSNLPHYILFVVLAFLALPIEAISDPPKIAKQYEISSGGIDFDQPDLKYVFDDSVVIVKFRENIVYSKRDETHIYHSIDSIFPILKSRQDKKLGCMILDAGYTRISYGNDVIHNEVNITNCLNVDSITRVKLFRGMLSFYNFQHKFEKSNKRLCDSLWLAGMYNDQLGGIYASNSADSSLTKYGKATIELLNSKKKIFDSTWNAKFPNQSFAE